VSKDNSAKALCAWNATSTLRALDKILSSSDNEYFIVIRRNFVLFWWGNLNAGFDAKENNYYPYISTIKANDFLGEIINDKEYTAITDLNISIAETTIKQFVDVSELSEWEADIFPFGTNELVLKTNLAWTAPNQLSYNNLNSVYNQFYINPQGFEGSSNYVGQYKKSETFKEVLKVILDVLTNTGIVCITVGFSFLGTFIHTYSLNNNSSKY